MENGYSCPFPTIPPSPSLSYLSPLAWATCRLVTDSWMPVGSTEAWASATLVHAHTHFHSDAPVLPQPAQAWCRGSTGLWLLVPGSPGHLWFTSLHTELGLELSQANYCSTCPEERRRSKVMDWGLARGLEGGGRAWEGWACLGRVLLQSLDGVVCLGLVRGAQSW